LGLVRLARGDAEEAQREFLRGSHPARRNSMRRFAMNAHDGAGFAHLGSGDPHAAAVQFRRALELFPEHARSLVGLGAALEAARGRGEPRRRSTTRRAPSLRFVAAGATARRP
jgi:hypothetical protein